MALEMEHKCMDCEKWNEHWYWTHLQHTRIRFSSLLTSGFHHRLIIPRKIVFKFRVHLVNTITLKSLLSGKTWTIGLEERDEDLFLNQGWQAFVKCHSLKKGDILTFQYEGNSTFVVSMFDGKSGYEKVGSCFNHGLPSNFETMETKVHVESMNNSSDDDNISLENGQSETETIEVETESEDHNPPTRKARKIERSSGIKLRSNHPSTSSKGKSVCKDPNSRDNGERIIKRRLISQTDKEKAYILACAFQSLKCTLPSFIVAMAPTSVCKNYFMTIPRTFAKEHIPTGVKEVALHLPPGLKKWVVTYTEYLNHGVGQPRGVGLRGEWKSFVLDNNLGQGDVCVFELTQLQGNKSHETIAMDVKIFRRI